jgi:hypothetical protein
LVLLSSGKHVEIEKMTKRRLGETNSLSFSSPTIHHPWSDNDAIAPVKFLII